jgi:G3E family GTPase
MENKETIEFDIMSFSKNMVRTLQRRIDEKHIIILGNQGSGKTTLFNNIIGAPSDDIKPTCGIYYNFIRYQTGSKKTLLNLYEIGGGVKNLPLVKTILNNKNLSNTIFILTLDFSKPETILPSLKDYVKELLSIIKDIAEQDTIVDVITVKQGKYRDTNSSDFRRLQIFPAEVIVVGTKYDCLEKMDMYILLTIGRRLNGLADF